MTSYYQNIDFGENGVCKGIYYGQNERVDELNTRIQSRHFPDVDLPPNFDPRPVSTRFCLFPVVDVRTRQNKEPMMVGDDQTYQRVVYNPGTDRGPPITFLKNIEVEAELRKEHIPNTNSDLYKPSLPHFPSQSTEKWSSPVILSQTNMKNTHEKYTTHIPNYLAIPESQPKRLSEMGEQKIGQNTFNNYTKTQLRNLTSFS
jgi:hypothetical protein